MRSAGWIWPGSEYAQGLATQAFGDGHVVDAIAIEFRGVEVVERQLHAVVHFKPTLCLTDQTQVGIVHHHVDVRQLELRAHGQFFDHELEVIVAGQRHHLAARVGLHHAECSRNGPAQRAGLAAVDPVAWLVHMQELRTGNLRQADGADVASVFAEHLVHLFVHALWLDRHVVEVSLAVQGGFALLAVMQPGAAVLELAGGFPLAGHFDKHRQCRTSVGNDAQVRREHAADLGRLDVHVDELAAFGVNLHRTRVAVGPTVADAQHHVRLEHRRVAITVGGLQANHAHHQRVIVGDGAPAHEGRDHRDTGEFSELHQQFTGVGVDHTTAADQQRAFGGVKQGQGFFDLDACRQWLGQGQRLVGVDVEFDLGHLHVERQVDQHWAWATGAHFIKGFLERVGHLAGFQNGGCPLGHRLYDAGDVHGLEVFLVHPCARGLAGYAQDRDRVGRGTVKAGDHVGARRARSADAHANIAGLGAGVTLGHVRGAFNVASKDVIDATHLLQG